MKVQEVSIAVVKPNNGLIGFASVVIDDGIYLSSIAIYTKLDGTYRILYPTKLLGNKSLGVFYPINRAAGKSIEQAIFKKCKEVFEGCNKNDRYNKAEYRV